MMATGRTMMPQHLSLTRPRDGNGSGSGVCLCASMAVTGQTIMPRHHHLSRACPRDGNGSSSGVHSCASMAATGQTMMPWHYNLSLACPRDGNCDDGSRGGARRQLVCKLITINRKKTINAFIILIFIHQLTQHKPTVHRAPSCIWWSES